MLTDGVLLHQQVRRTDRRYRRNHLGALLVVLAIIAIPVGFRWHSAAPPTASSFTADVEASPLEAGGAVPDGTTVFDTDVAGVARLDPALLAALWAAADDAADDGIEIVVNSGWRSAAYQAELLDEAIADHGGRDEAARWVAAPDRSPHVAGKAVDVGPAGARAWLAEHGSRYGLCPIYDNEPWHYELRPDATDHGCPAPYADPTSDPRMQP